MSRVRFTQKSYYGDRIVDAGEVLWVPTGVPLSAQMVVLPPDPTPEPMLFIPDVPAPTITEAPVEAVPNPEGG